MPGHSRFSDLNDLAIHFTIGAHAVQVVYWGFIPPEWWRNYLHVHSFFEVCYAFAGRGTFRIDESDYTVTAGDVFIAPPRLAHEIIASTDDPLGIYFWAYSLTEVTPARDEPSDLGTLLRDFIRSTRYVSARAPSMQTLLDLLTAEIIDPVPGIVQSVQGLVSKLVIDTARAGVDVAGMVPIAASAGKSAAERTTQTILRYLHDNYARPLTLRDAAAQVHLSERHTNRLFKKQTGQSIADYLAAHRLKTASALLLDPTCSIKAVARLSGYPDVRYFTTVFRRHTGLTPAKYRKQHGTQFL